MKPSSILAAASLFVVAQAQSQCISVALAIPACATSCLQSAASKVGCGPLDFACQCGASSSSVINSAAFGCVLSTCGPQTGLVVQTSAASVCACASSAGGGGGGGGSSAGHAFSSAVASSLAASSMGSPKAGTSVAASSMMSSGAASAGSSAFIASSTAAASVASSAAPAGSSAASSSGASSTGAGLEIILSIGTGLAVFLGIVAAL